jgi:hypothetical protein
VQQFVVPALPTGTLKQPRVKSVCTLADENLARRREKSTVDLLFDFRKI